MKKYFLRSLMLLLIISINGHLFAQIPNGYYSAAEGKKKAELKTALHLIIQHANVLVYGSGEGKTWSGFAKTDIRPEDGTVWDMYSNKRVMPNGNSAATGMNIEHSFANSWWGGDKRQAYMDIHHLNPSDIAANSAKGSWPMAVVDGSVTYNNGVIKVGKSNSRPGGVINAWEPADEYKGDFARQYMYMATCYEDYANDWTGNSAGFLMKNTYPVFEQWAYELLLKWCKADPVSQKELNRNNEIYKIQGNRNPYIDYPELADYIWGDKTATAWYTTGTTDPVLYAPANNSTTDMGVTILNGTLEKEISVSGKNLTGDLSISVSGTGYSVDKSVLTKEEVVAGAKILVHYTSALPAVSTGALTLSGGGVSVSVNLTAEAVDGIPALSPGNVTSNSFVASWKNIGGATTYQLNLYQSDKVTSVNGYPMSVDAATEKTAIANLTPATTYYYQLTGGGYSSKLIEVKTLEPIPAMTVIQLDGDLNFTVLPDVTSNAKRISVSTEYLNNDISVKVDAPFELSVDQQTWSNAITLGTVGGTFYVRMASSAAGSYQSALTLTTSDIDEPEELSVTGSAELPKTFFEDFEAGAKGAYTPIASVACTMTSWTFDNSLVMSTESKDLKNGAKSARLRPAGAVYMNTDKQNGVGTLSLYAGTFGTDAATVIGVYYSSNGGTTWSTVANNVSVSNSLKEYRYSVDVSGPVRVKVTNLTGSGGSSRVNVDDISMTDYTSTGISQKESDSFSSYVQNNQLVIKNNETQIICIYTISGQIIYKQKLMPGVTSVTLPQGLYILSGDGIVKKVIIN